VLTAGVERDLVQFDLDHNNSTGVLIVEKAGQIYVRFKLLNQ